MLACMFYCMLKCMIKCMGERGEAVRLLLCIFTCTRMLRRTRMSLLG